MTLSVQPPQQPPLSPSALKTGHAGEKRSMFQRADNWLRSWLQHRFLPWHLAVLAMLLCAPSLWMGLTLDDYFHRAALTMQDLPQISRSPAELFVFIEGNKILNRLAIAMGYLPWWTNEELRIAFFRPLTGITHWLDYKIWPDFQWLMHLQSLVWFGAVVAAAAFFYKRMFRFTWIAGLAALLFAVDDAHGLPAVWLANRNALISLFFGLLTLILYDRWRRDSWWMGAILAPPAFLLGLLAKESSLAIGAYLVAYALFLDRGTRVTRFFSLFPCALIGVIWWIVYKELNYGVFGSGWYLDPFADIGLFIRAIAHRAPMLLAWQWLVPSNLEWALSPLAAKGLWLATMGALVIIALLLVPLLRRDSLARFWALGMVLSLLPACIAYPSARLLSFVGIGGIGLLAQLIAAAFQKKKVVSLNTRQLLPARAFCFVLIFLHLGVAPWALFRTQESFMRIGGIIGEAATSLPSDKTSLVQTVIIVNTPTFATIGYGILSGLAKGVLSIRQPLVLGSSCRPIRVHRQDERTLLIRPKGGFLPQPGSPGNENEMEQLLFNQFHGVRSLDRIYCNNGSLTKGQQINLFGMVVEITALTENGLPAEAAFRFTTKLENPYFQWMQWDGSSFVPFTLPAVGETVTLEGKTSQMVLCP